MTSRAVSTNQGNPDERGKLLTVAEAAERLNVGETFIRRLIFQRRIAFQKIGYYVRIYEADLDAFVAANRVEVGAAR